VSLEFFPLVTEVSENTAVTERMQVYRAKILGGWLVLVTSQVAGYQHEKLTFVPDADHTWNGESLP